MYSENSENCARASARHAVRPRAGADANEARRVGHPVRRYRFQRILQRERGVVSGSRAREPDLVKTFAPDAARQMCVQLLARARRQHPAQHAADDGLTILGSRSQKSFSSAMASRLCLRRGCVRYMYYVSENRSERAMDRLILATKRNPAPLVSRASAGSDSLCDVSLQGR